MKVIAPIVEALLAVLFIGGAPFIWAFGVWGVATTFFPLLPSAVQNSYWWEFNEERLYMSQQLRDGVALFMILVGLFFLAGLWGSYPQCRKPVGTAVITSFVGMSLFVLWVMGQAGIRMGSF